MCVASGVVSSHLFAFVAIFSGYWFYEGDLIGALGGVFGAVFLPVPHIVEVSSPIGGHLTTM
jgi:hypothetical protein